ncbi:MAG: autoinducer 2 ABC transporter substrate-binding protein [Candidatus Aphodomonas sp.]|nr:autoinducer 2 ABC transporter substrate-binding protein [Candidatus Aphodomonas sp.]
MKKILSLIVALAMVLSCTAALAEDMTVVVMPKLVGIPYFNASETGALAAGEELGINVIYTGPTTGDAALQVQMIEDLLIDGIDALAIAPNDPDSVSPALQKCQADGVLVMDWDTTANGDDVTYSIQQIDNKVLGEMLFDLLVEAMGTDEGEYAIVTGYLTAANLNTWIDFGKAYAAEKYPNLTLVTDPVPSDESAQEAYTQTMALIAAYPNLKGIIGYSTPGPIGAAMAVQEKGLQDQIAVVGTSMPTDSAPYLKDGSLDFGVLWDPAQLGKLAVYVAYLTITGQTVEGYEVPGVGPIHINEDGKTIIMADPSVWTAENVDNYNF